MNYRKLDIILEECINYDMYKKCMNNLYKNILPICKKILSSNEKIYISDGIFSIDYKLNEKIKLISKFLREIDLNLYHQFETIISSLDEDNKPIVNFVNNENKISRVDGKTGKVYIYLKNNLYDFFTILHELVHCMNYYIIEEQNYSEIHNRQSNVKYLFNESAPIIAEKLFGEWLIKNGYITQIDFNIIKNRRFESIKSIAKSLIIESEYIKIKQQELEVTEKNIEKYKQTLDKNSIEYKLLTEEIDKNLVAKTILHFEMLRFPKTQKYVIAYNMLENFNLDKKGINNFLKLQKMLGDLNPNLKKYK